MSFTVGFDLDMTLIDPRKGMIEVFDVLAQETGIPLDGRAFASRLGPPLADEFARYGVVGPDSDRLVRRYRELYEDVVIPLSAPMLGAREAVESVTDRGGSVVVVSGKYGPHVQAHLDAVGITVAGVEGELWSTGKARALAGFGAEVYVGDHVGDIDGARAADALAVGVATGPKTAPELEAAGADAVLASLREFPAWLDAYLSVTVH